MLTSHDLHIDVVNEHDTIPVHIQHLFVVEAHSLGATNFSHQIEQECHLPLLKLYNS